MNITGFDEDVYKSLMQHTQTYWNGHIAAHHRNRQTLIL